ncbi:MAG: YigZ family protein, partial [Bacteroidales bacterium]|nr:YigZ family protein [Bacteroidales bacterium]
SMVEKYSDNGEPSGTAGRPMMGAMQKAELTNVLIIAVRYFGGILLGTPGLIAAYREAATQALQASTIVTRTQEAQLT